MSPHLHLVPSKAKQTTIIWCQLVKLQMQVVKRYPKHHISRAPLVNDNSVYPLPTVTTEITTRSSSCGTTSPKSALVKQRSASACWSDPRAFTIITSLVYFLRLEMEHLLLKILPRWCSTRHEQAPHALGLLRGLLPSIPLRSVRRTLSKIPILSSPLTGSPELYSAPRHARNPCGTRTSLCDPKFLSEFGGTSAYQSFLACLTTPCKSYRAAARKADHQSLFVLGWLFLDE